MEQRTFEIMYNALVEIATARTFFDGENELAQIAKQALQKKRHRKKSHPNTTRGSSHVNEYYAKTN